MSTFFYIVDLKILEILFYVSTWITISICTSLLKSIPMIMWKWGWCARKLSSLIPITLTPFDQSPSPLSSISETSLESITSLHPQVFAKPLAPLSELPPEPYVPNWSATLPSFSSTIYSSHCQSGLSKMQIWTCHSLTKILQCFSTVKSKP